MSNLLLVLPMLAMLALTFFIALIMMWTRVQAMKEYRIAPNRAEEASNLKTLLPRNVMRISDNYNHLHEQPIVFYVLCTLTILLDAQDMIFAYLAWGYVATRLLHSAVQIVIADVMKRFFLFMLSWLVLGIMLVRLATELF